MALPVETGGEPGDGDDLSRRVFAFTSSFLLEKRSATGFAYTLRVYPFPLMCMLIWSEKNLTVNNLRPDYPCNGAVAARLACTDGSPILRGITCTSLSLVTPESQMCGYASCSMYHLSEPFWAYGTT